MIAHATIKVGHVLDELAKLPERSVHACLTSPPYWGLRDYKLEDQDWNGWRGSLGLEPTIDLFLDHLVSVFDSVKRVLRDDGTLWVNLGDSYAAGGMGGHIGGLDGRAPPQGRGNTYPQKQPTDGLKPLDCCNIPMRFALRMQAEGWYHRSTIIWAKGVSFCESYSGSVMPESINGWRWERCRVKVAESRAHGVRRGVDGVRSGIAGEDPDWQPDWSDCPGCDKCRDTGGLVLRKGSWRPTSAYEFVFLFAKTKDYYCDAEAVREANAEGSAERYAYGFNSIDKQQRDGQPYTKGGTDESFAASGRNLRNVWTINPQPFPDAHFATFPESLVEPIIKVSTPEKGVCPECGSPWARVVETSQRLLTGSTGQHRGDGQRDPANRHDIPPERTAKESSTLGWRPTCGCHNKVEAAVIPHDPIHPMNYACPKATPATVLDPFAGSGTTLLVARKLGRHSVGVELSEDYAEMARKRVGNYAPLFARDED